jgi:hypothetical protein
MNIREAIEATAVGRKEIQGIMDSKATYHPDDANIYSGLKRSVARDVSETLHKASLQEILSAATSADSAGAYYLMVPKVYDTLLAGVRLYDITPVVSAYMIENWGPTSTLTVDVAADPSFRAKRSSSGAQSPDETVKTTKITMTAKFLSTDIGITNELVEDSAMNIMAWHIQHAGEAHGYAVTKLALASLITGTDGDGTLGSSLTGDADSTKFSGGATSDLNKAVKAIGLKEWNPDTIICTNEAWQDAIGAYATSGWLTTAPTSPGFNLKYGFMDVMFRNDAQLHDAADTTSFTNCITLVFDRRNALITARKRWLQLEHYSDPTRDIGDAVITSRVATASLYNDAIYKLTET